MQNEPAACICDHVSADKHVQCPVDWYEQIHAEDEDTAAGCSFANQFYIATTTRWPSNSKYPL